MCCRNAAWLPVAALLFASCSHKPEPVNQRIAVTRFENLTSDAGLDWMGRAASEVLSADLSSSAGGRIIPSSMLHGAGRSFGVRPVTAPGVSSERTEALATGATQIIFGRISSAAGNLRLDATVYNPRTLKTELSVSAAGPISAGIIPLADSLARELPYGAARAFGTRNDEALKQYVRAIESPSADDAARGFAASVAADPNFGPAWVAWVQMEIARQNRAEAERILALATAKGRAMAGADRLRLDLTLYRSNAETDLNARHYRAAVENLEKALKLQPADPALWNQLGYAQAYAGDLAGATESLRRYATLRPDDPNVPDSLGDVNFRLGHFRDAETFYLQSVAKDRNFEEGTDAIKAAWARLMTGDVAAADTLFNQYLAGRRAANDPFVPLRQADWDFLAGRRGRAVQLLESFAPRAGQAAPDIYARLVVWDLVLGDSAAARRNALNAGRTGKPIAALCRLLTEPPASASEWTARTDKTFGSAESPLRDLSLAYALLLAKQFQAAEPVLKLLYDRSSPLNEEGLPVLLAWARIETGRLSEAAPLLETNPIPRAATDMFTCLYFPRLFLLRSEVLNKEDAHRNRELFQKLGGADDRFVSSAH